MDKFIVEKSPPLKGHVKIDGSKNAVLPIMAASLLTNKKCIIKNVPFLSDVIIMQELLTCLGAEFENNENENIIKINSENVENIELPYNLVKKIRASFLIAGPLLAKFGNVKIQMPGGCPIGVRPVDLHLKGFSLLGADISQEHGVIEINAKKLKGSEIYLDFPSVGATENIMMAATMAEGETIISNCAVEPEIVDLAVFLNKIGCKIVGAGSDTIKITGVKNLDSCTHSIIPDRIEAGTFMVASAITNGDVIIDNIICEHLKAITAKLKEINAEVIENDTSIEVRLNEKLKNVDIKTMPYPGFPTDMQAQFMGLLSQSEGTGIINETVFENRFMHIGELNRMGADIKVESKSAIIKGVDRLTGTQVKATDLRAGAALILTALSAEGMTEIGEIHHIDRGYYKIEEKLKKLGAKIKRV